LTLLKNNEHHNFTGLGNLQMTTTVRCSKVNQLEAACCSLLLCSETIHILTRLRAHAHHIAKRRAELYTTTASNHLQGRQQCVVIGTARCVVLAASSAAIAIATVAFTCHTVPICGGSMQLGLPQQPRAYALPVPL
jgi:hypothetical protein